MGESLSEKLKMMNRVFFKLVRLPIPHFFRIVISKTVSFLYPISKNKLNITASRKNTKNPNYKFLKKNGFLILKNIVNKRTLTKLSR